MFFPKLWDAIQNSPLGIFMAESPWAFPTFETIHVFAIVTVFGTIAVMDMRMIGLASKGRPLTAVSKDTLTLTWTAFVVAAITGSLLFTGKATYYMVNPWFLGKMALMGLAGVNMIAFHLIPWKNVRNFDVATVIPGGVRRAGILSLLLWIGVICCGRMIGFTLDKYLPF
jgi:uncharacterized membrane protein